MTPSAEATEPATGSWRIVLGLALIGALLGFGWGIADQPVWRATATVVVESDSQGSDQARLERFAQRGGSEEVATKAAGLLGDDVPGADLLAQVTVRPSPRGGFLVIAADADAPDVAAAAADGYQRALVAVEGDPLAPGKAARIPSEPYEDRSAALWAGIGFLAGLLVGLLTAGLLVASRRRGVDAAPRAAPPSVAVDPPAAFADRLGARLTDFDPGAGGTLVRADGGGVEIPRQAVAEVGMLADRLRIRAGGGPRSLAITAVGDGVDVTGLAAALAAAAAGAGRSVLLVEADLAAPQAAGRLGVASAPGLADYLNASASPREVLRSVEMAPGGTTGFVCVPAGMAGGDASLAGDRFAGLVRRLDRVYDLVIYVAPAILDGPDAEAVARLTEAVAVVVGSGADPDLDDAAGRLEGAHVTVVAAVFG